jgi:threonine/homoserine/homoserine lactone efflux protein
VIAVAATSTCETPPVLNDAIGAILPAAAGVALSPIPIVAVVLMLASERARSNGLAFAVGWVAGLSVVSVVVLVVAGGSSDPDSTAATGVNGMQVAIGALFLVMAMRQWRKRPKEGESPEMPKWMATVETITPVKSLGLGIALSAVNPKNLALTLAASASIAKAGLDASGETAAVIVFVVIGSITVVGAVLAYLVAPRWAAGPLEAIRHFMSDNNATIMMVILLILGLKILGEGIGGF